MATTTAPSDPYRILGVDADSDAAAIKKAYRKLVLSCHPDKVTDESLKAQKQEEFHQIQQAYETIGDPDNRTKYDLELKAKRLREERDRMAPKGSSTPQSRNVNINIYTAPHPSEYRSSPSKHSPAKPASYKPYSAEFSKSWEHSIPTRSRAYEEKKTTRRTYSDEKLNDDRRRRDDERDRDRRRKQEEEDDRRKRQARREREKELLERERQEKARLKEIARRKEQQDRQDRDDRLREKKSRERAAEKEREAKRRQEADEKLRAKMRSQEHTSEDDDDRRSRAKKPSKKDSPRDKTPSKYRERSSPRDEAVPEVPSAAEALESKMAYAALYIRGQQAKKNGKSSPKHTADVPSFSDAYPDPEQWKPKRRVSGEKPPKAATEATINDAASPPVSPSSQQAPPRLHKSYTMGHVPTSEPRPTLGRAQTFDPEAFARSMGPERPRMSRHHSSIDEEDFYSTPRVQKYSIRNDKGGMPHTVYETSQYRDPYSAGGTFPKVKTTQSYGPEHLSHSKRYDPAEVAFADYSTAQQQAYVAMQS